MCGSYTKKGCYVCLKSQLLILPPNYRRHFAFTFQCVYRRSIKSRMANHYCKSKSNSSSGEGPHRACVISEGRRKIHTTFSDGSEMLEEYDLQTDLLVLRKTRQNPHQLRIGHGGLKNSLNDNNRTSIHTFSSNEEEWIYEVGMPPLQKKTSGEDEKSLLKPSVDNPIFGRSDTKKEFVWRVRNLTFPENVFSVSVDKDKDEIVVRTSNKKYYKRIAVPDLRRFKLKLKERCLKWNYKFHTLIIMYEKPKEILEYEEELKRECEQNAIMLNPLGH